MCRGNAILYYFFVITILYKHVIYNAEKMCIRDSIQTVCLNPSFPLVHEPAKSINDINQFQLASQEDSSASSSKITLPLALKQLYLYSIIYLNGVESSSTVLTTFDVGPLQNQESSTECEATDDT